MKTYQFIGEGKGVPGLPHKLTEADAQRLDVERLLADALKAKIYDVVAEKQKTVPVQAPVQEQKRKAERYSARTKEA